MPNVAAVKKPAPIISLVILNFSLEAVGTSLGLIKTISYDYCRIDVSNSHRSTSTCKLNLAGAIIATICPFLKGSHISKTEEATPTKIGVYAFDIDPYLHKFFEPISIN